MSDQMSFKIRYAVEFSRIAVSSLASCMDEAIRENWQSHTQVRGMTLMDLSSRWEDWLSITSAEHMMKFDEDECEEDDLDPLISEEVELPFSPASSWLANFGVSRSLEGKRKASFVQVSV